MLHFHFITAVWGAAYVDLFLDVALPNQLTPGNLLYFGDQARGATYRIYTLPEDAERIRSAPGITRLFTIMPVEVIVLDNVDVTRKYVAMNECHRQAITAAELAGAAMVFLSPDAVWSDGTFRYLWETASAGKRAIMVGSIRLVKETFVPAYLARHYSKEDGSATISSCHLVELAMDHLHPLTESLCWDSDTFRDSPSHVYWRVGNEGILARCFHLHPLMVNPVRKGLLPESSVDGDYTPLACPDADALHVVEDSDDVAGFELSARDQFGAFRRNRSSALDVAFFAHNHAHAHHRRFFNHNIWFRAKPRSPRWHSAEQTSERLLRAVRLYLRFYVLFLGGKLILSNTKHIARQVLGDSRIHRLKRALKQN